MVGDYRGSDGPRGFWWNEGVTPSDIHRRLPAICGERAPERSTVFNWV